MQLLSTLPFLFTTLLTISHTASAHLHMSNMPGVYLSNDNLPPIQPSGSDFPCGVTDFSRKNGNGPTLTPGKFKAGKINLQGTAVHSGGSCQIAITYDSPPNKNSDWRVLKSFEGNCPIKKPAGLGNLDPNLGINHKLPTLVYTIPSGMAGGKATVAWTWVNSSGNREFYMRCQQVTIAGNVQNKEVFNALPPMFVANVRSENSCTTDSAAGKSIRYPLPGKAKFGTGDADPNGNDCFTAAERRKRGKK